MRNLALLLVVAIGLVAGCPKDRTLDPPPTPTPPQDDPDTLTDEGGGHDSHGAEIEVGIGEGEHGHGHGVDLMDDAARPEADGVMARESMHPAHRFEDANKWAKRFESPKRDRWQRPAYVIKHLGLDAESVVVDIGSATGYFPMRIAPHVPKGRVWGVDIEPDMVNYLNERARREKQPNVFSLLGQPNDPMIPEPADVVLLVNTYHHIGDRPAYFRALQRHLKDGARVAIVDFRKESKGGPPKHMKMRHDEVTAEMTDAGYKLVAHHDELPEQYYLVFMALPPG